MARRPLSADVSLAAAALGATLELALVLARGDPRVAGSEDAQAAVGAMEHELAQARARLATMQGLARALEQSLATPASRAPTARPRQERGDIPRRPCGM